MTSGGTMTRATTTTRDGEGFTASAWRKHWQSRNLSGSGHRDATGSCIGILSRLCTFFLCQRLMNCTTYLSLDLHLKGWPCEIRYDTVRLHIDLVMRWCSSWSSCPYPALIRILSVASQSGRGLNF